MDEATRFIFGKRIDYRSLNLASGLTTISGKSHPKGKNFPWKGRVLGHVIVFGMKPRFLKFANASAMESATPEVKNFPRKGCGVGHVTAV